MPQELDPLEDENTPAHIKCRIYRERAGSTPEVIAEELGVTVSDVLLMEKGGANPDTLLWYWES